MCNREYHMSNFTASISSRHR